MRRSGFVLNAERQKNTYQYEHGYRKNRGGKNDGRLAATTDRFSLENQPEKLNICLKKELKLWPLALSEKCPIRLPAVPGFLPCTRCHTRSHTRCCGFNAHYFLDDAFRDEVIAADGQMAIVDKELFLRHAFFFRHSEHIYDLDTQLPQPR